MRRLAAVAAGAVLAACACATASAQEPRGLALGFSDGAFSGPAPDRDPWLDRSVQAGAGIVRIDVGWVAPDTQQRPAGFDARDPADPAYDFSRADAAVRDASGRGLRVLLAFSGAPRWAEGPGRPVGAPPGSWRPDPAAIEDYGAALALRYSGRFPDPEQPGATLPQATAFQLWNEPNLDKYLSPQWVGRRAASPGIYRAMLNAFYRGVKSVGTRALVVTAGTAPFGDPQPGGARIMPARFVRELLCLRQEGPHLRPAACREPAHFDVLSHHPYSVGTPARAALNADDVSIADVGKLTRALRAAEHTGGALPRIRHRLWVTEVSYDSGPPDPHGVPLDTHARFLEACLYQLWRQGVDTVFWFQVGDQPPTPSYAATNQSGVYFHDGRPKPALHAFSFPLVAWRTAGGVALWGVAPRTGTLTIERRTGSGWTLARRFQARAHEVFVTHFSHYRNSTLRARVGSAMSLPWSNRKFAPLARGINPEKHS